jgi:apolipoprotein N-acyltransferase
VRNLAITLTGSLLLWVAWPESSFTFLIFIAWLPLLWIEEKVPGGKKFFWLAYLHMFIWNIATTWWIWNASPAGSLGAFFANSLLMCIPWILFRITKRSLGRWIGYCSLIIYWLTFEYIHHNWELTWPWLTLGNAFAETPQWVQWFEYTGTTGGSLWILVSNIIIYSLFVEHIHRGRTRNYYIGSVAILLVLVLPIILSKNKPAIESNESVNVVVVQPNVDPYLKCQQGAEEGQLQNLIKLSESMMDARTQLIVWPETAIPLQTDEKFIKENEFYAPLWAFLKRHPTINLLTGVEGYQVFDKKNSINSRELQSQPGYYYESYNSAVLFDSSSYQIYHKSKLVPGVEKLPGFLKFMDKLFEKFGGTTGGYSPQDDRTVLNATNSPVKIAPAICYESIYGDFMTGFMRNGANLICIITNDAWWGETPGHRQHLQYARLRAIETRKWIVRSANTGISCFIDPYGTIINPQAWNTISAIKMQIPLVGYETFFVRHGDMLSRAGCVVSIILVVASMFARWRNSK